jgi:hypothetical protein
MVPVMIFGANHGIIGLAAAYIPVQILEFPAALYLANRVLQVSPIQVWSAAHVPLIATLAMAVVVIVVEAVMLQVLRVGDTLTLLSCLALAVVVYVGSLLALDRKILREALSVVNRGL